MKARSTYQIMQDMKAAKQAEEEERKAIVTDAHPDTIRRVFEMQQEQIPCTFCGTVTKTDVHVDYNGGISVFTKYVCPKCKNEFFEKDFKI